MRLEYLKTEILVLFIDIGIQCYWYNSFSWLIFYKICLQI